ncbi:cupin domain-containing protein [Adhaeribacter aquaticus]|uniref:cupin domain-containing protein n=1 Tax=Adhaeribacter aquaticus TaxID=299567 RepID=UPI0003F5B594|nr:cupin domain-containing protein [Adhaeribacter aquaticus]
MNILQEAEFRKIANQLTFNQEKFTSQVISEKDGQKIILFVFAQGQGLKTHTTSSPALLLVLEGSCCFTIYGKEQDLKPGENIRIPANEPHSVMATIDCKVVLIK